MISTETNQQFHANPDRYKTMRYRRCGRSGVLLPALSLGLWQNFGEFTPRQTARDLLHCAFDLGITHFDLANNYGPPYGAAETTFGEIYRQDFQGYRDELFISSKAGYDMWSGPYGDGGSRKYLVASCDQSLKRTGLDYFDVFYHHCSDADTPLEETMLALDFLVRSGRALYVGISNYDPQQTRQAIQILKDLGTPLLVHQPRYNLFDRWIEGGLTDVLIEHGVGCVVFSPLDQGLLTDRYLGTIPADSRAAQSQIIHFEKDDITDEKLAKVAALNDLARERGQSLAQMALAWVLHNEAVTSCIIGASRTEQIVESVAALERLDFDAAELPAIRQIVE